MSVQINPRAFDYLPVIQLSDKVFRLWMRSLCWQSEHGTDGWVSDPVLAHLAQTRAWRPRVAELLDAGLLEPLNGGEYRLARSIGAYDLWRPGPRWGSRPPIPPALRRAVYERDGYRCVNCAATDDLTLDHILHFSAGGPDTYSNLRTLCRPCNSSRHTRTDDEWLGGV